MALFTNSIGRKLATVLTAITLLMIVIGAIGFGGALMIRNNLETNLAKGFNIEDLATDVQTQLLEARSQEEDYLLHIENMDLDEAHRLYITTWEEHIGNMKDDLNTLREIFIEEVEQGDRSHEEDIVLIDELLGNVSEYEVEFKSVVTFIEARGSINSGILQDARDDAHNLEVALDELNNPQVIIIYLQIRRSEKDYMLRGTDSYIDSVNNLLDDLNTQVRRMEISATQRNSLQELSSNYRTSFGNLAAIDDQIADEINTYRTVLEEIDSELLTLVADGRLIYSQAQDGILQISTIVMWTIGVSLVIAVVINFVLSITVSRSITVPLGQLMIGTRRVSDGNLDYSIELDQEDELGALADAFNEMTMNVRETTEEVVGKVENLSELTQQTREMVTTLISSTTEIQAATTQQSASAVEQDATVAQTVATVEELRTTVVQTAERANDVAETARASIDVSRSGQDSVTDSIEGMEAIQQQVENIAENILILSKRTQQIGEIIETVNGLAEQSKLLALNASIEAARAGEEGKGFAVVAMEVRQLADQSREATSRVRNILGEIQQATNTAVMVTEEGSKRAEQGMVLVERAGDAIRDLSGTIENTAQSAIQIAASTQQQLNGMDQLTAAMAQIQQATTQTAISTQQTEKSITNLLDLANQMEDAARTYESQDK